MNGIFPYFLAIKSQPKVEATVRVSNNDLIFVTHKGGGLQFQPNAEIKVGDKVTCIGLSLEDFVGKLVDHELEKIESE